MKNNQNIPFLTTNSFGAMIVTNTNQPQSIMILKNYGRKQRYILDLQNIKTPLYWINIMELLPHNHLYI